MSAEVLHCYFANEELGWWAEGLCPYFRGAAHTEDAQKRIQLAARRFHQPAIYKWWPHRWG